MFWQLRIAGRLGIFSEMKFQLYRRVQILLLVSESQIESKTGLKISAESLKSETWKNSKYRFFSGNSCFNERINGNFLGFGYKMRTVESCVHHLDSGRKDYVGITGPELKQASDTMNDTVTSIVRGDFPPRPSPSCTQCDWRRICSHKTV